MKSPDLVTAELYTISVVPDESWVLRERRRQVRIWKVSQQICGWKKKKIRRKEKGKRVVSKESGFSCPWMRQGWSIDPKLRYSAFTFSVSLQPMWAPEHLSWAHIHQGEMPAGEWLTPISRTRKLQVQLPWTLQDPREAAWPVTPFTLCLSSALSWTSGPLEKALQSTWGNSAPLWDNGYHSDSQTEPAEVGKGTTRPREQQASRILSSICKLN